MLINFYQDESKQKIDPELLDKKAEQVATSFIEYKNDRVKNQVSSHQLRRFYNEIKNLQKKMNYEEWDTIYPLIKMIKSKVAYATSDLKIKWYEQKVYQQFKNFLVSGIDSVNDKKDFEAFCKYFEAVLGFYYGLIRREG